jgi:hypothetical protein
MNDSEMQYDKDAIEQHVLFFNKIFDQQKHLSKVIEINSNAQIQKTTNIIISMTPVVNQHHDTIHELDNKIRTIITSNKNNLKNDTKYQEFKKTKLCTDFTKKIHEIDSLVFNLKKLLNKEGIQLLPKN